MQQKEREDIKFGWTKSELINLIDLRIRKVGRNSQKLQTMDSLRTIAYVAKKFGVKEGTVYVWVREGWLDTVKIANNQRIYTTDKYIEALIRFKNRPTQKQLQQETEREIRKVLRQAKEFKQQ